MQTATATTTPAAPARSASFSRPGVLGLEGGDALAGTLHGAVEDDTIGEGELVFTTAATGWGEILTDPSYAGQIVVLTHPMAGNYRIDRAELESSRVQARGLVVTRLIDPPPGAGMTLGELLREGRIPAISGIDTRALTLRLRNGEPRRAVIAPGNDGDDAVARARAGVPWDAVDHVGAVATREPYDVAPAGERRARATLIDYGVKRSLLTALADRGLHVTVLPPDATVGDVEAGEPDLVVLSPGPGDPSRMLDQIATVGALAQRAAAADGPPILGICLGHQLLALAAGALTARLAVGHHGGNHAVLELETERVDIGAHNHEIEVVDSSALAAAGYRVSHRDLNDGTVEGLAHESGRIASVQFHPEGAPGPIDAARVFDLALERALA